MDIPEDTRAKAWETAWQDAMADVANHPLSVTLLKAWFESGLEAGAEWARKQTLEDVIEEIRLMPSWADGKGNDGFDIGPAPKREILNWLKEYN